MRAAKRFACETPTSVSAINPTAILKTVCAYYAIDAHRVLAGNRSRIHMIARRLSIQLSTEYCCASRSDIAKSFGLQLSSVRYSLRAHTQETDANYLRDFETLKAKVLPQ